MYKSFGLAKGVYMPFALSHHLLGHVEYITRRTVVHHGIRKHEVHVPLKLERVRDISIFDPRLDSLEVHWPFDDVVIVGCFRILDRVVKNIAVAML